MVPCQMDLGIKDFKLQDDSVYLFVKPMIQKNWKNKINSDDYSVCNL